MKSFKFNKTIAMWRPVVLLVLILAVGLSLAWVASNRNVGHHNSDMEIDADQVLAMPVSTYWVDYADDLHGATEYHHAAGQMIDLPAYDSVFTEYNEHCDIIMRVPVVGEIINEKDEFTITISLKEMPGATDNNYYADSRKTDMGLFLSNIVTIKYAVIPELNDVDDSQKETIYDTAKAVLNNINSSYSFFDGDENKINSLTVDVKNYKDSRIKIDDEESAYMLHVYFEITYDDELVQNLMEHIQLFQDVEGNKFNIVSDLKQFAFDVGSEN